ncbi:MAG: MBL fold metallo-hydrolase [Candidatus Marinimicrobia bacterium]|nr:MBL fold metallo-hydrolase [Candidatus Neomarinimicrobiota bacterium]
MRIGRYKLYEIETSRFRLDGGAMFGIIPKPLWEKYLPADEKNRIEMSTRSLLLVSDEHKILVDTGNGDKWQEKFKAIYDIDTKSVNLESSLARHGFTVEDITDVYNTHMHFDHIAGGTRLVDGKIEPTFSNARYWFQKDNWALANSPGEKEQGSFMEADWKILAENGMVELVNGLEEFLPCVKNLVVNGHTDGQMLPLISDGSHSLLYCGDLIPTTAHIPLPWIMAYDVRPLETLQEKQVLLPQAVEENWTLFFEHDPKIAATTVKYDGKHYRKNQVVNI